MNCLIFRYCQSEEVKIMAMPQEEIQERTRLLALLQSLERLGAENKIPLQQALAKQAVLKEGTTTQDLKQLINSPESRHREPAKKVMRIWAEMIKESSTIKTQKTAPTNKELVQPGGTAKSSEELELRRLKLEGWGQKMGV